MFERLLSLAFLALRFRKRALTVGGVLAALCLPLAVLLYGNLKSSIEELLPRSAPSIRALDELHARFGDNLQLAVLVSGAPAADLHRFADRFAQKARESPSLAPRFIDYRPGEVEEFFRTRKALFLSTADLETIEQRIRARVTYEVESKSPLSLGLEDDPGPPPVAFDDIAKKYEKRATSIKTHPSGYYDGADGQSLAMIFYPGQGVTGYKASLKFREGVREAAQKAQRELGFGAVRIQFAGDIQSVILEQRSLEADLVTSSVIVLLAEFVLILFAFGYKPAFGALGVPLAVGTLVTFAVSYVAVGSVNASTAFLGSIIVGNGVNPGIILFARFLEERRRGLPSEPAMTVAIRETAQATFIASAAAALSYGALMTTTFRGYSQFGLMGGTGMALCWLATYLLLPPAAMALDARFPVGPRPPGRVGFWDRVFGAVGRLGLRYRAAAVGLAALIAVVCTIRVVRFARDPFEYDTTKLMSSTATEPGGFLDVDNTIDRILARVITPVVVLVQKESDVADIANRYQKLIDDGRAGLVLGDVLTIRTLVPDEQPKKIATLGRIQKLLRGERMERLDPDQRDKAKELLAAADAQPFGPSDLPESVRRQLREKDGSEGKLVLLFPKHGSDTRDGRVVVRFAHEVRSVALPSGAVVAGSYLVFSDMLESIGHDGPLATIVALSAVLFLSLWLARGARGTVAVSLSLVLGVLTTAGAAAALHMRINFLNFIALPITFGIGLDYAVNIYGRYRRSAASSETLTEAVSRSSSAVALCSGTTIIGYSSLLFSRNGALFSFGLLAVLGEIACLVSALLLLPALLTRAEKPETACPSALPD